jgi:hypothetical protein
MADVFPIYINDTEADDAGNSPPLTYMDCDMPTSRSIGNGLLMFYVVGAGDESYISVDQFTVIDEHYDSRYDHTLGMAYRIVDGSERSYNRLLFNTESIYNAICNIVQFEAGTFEPWDKTLPEWVVEETPGGDTSPLGPILTPSWGTAKTFWITGADAGASIVTSFPSGWTELANLKPWTASLGSCYKAQESPTNPGATDDIHWNLPPSYYLAFTAAVAPILKNGGGFGAFGL